VTFGEDAVSSFRPPVKAIFSITFMIPEANGEPRLRIVPKPSSLL
jgi:hypothetical protein